MAAHGSPSPGYGAQVALRVVVMGVSGSGKTTVGRLLARRAGLDYADADDFHDPADVAKMAAAIPLTDADRAPWLEAIAQWLAEHDKIGGVVSCSALRRSYRDVLRTGGPDVWFLHLSGSATLVTERVADRPRHFMPAALVESQLETLEPPESDERAVTLDASLRPDAIIDDFLLEVVRQATRE
jgi:gluconokinase